MVNLGDLSSGSEGIDAAFGKLPVEISLETELLEVSRSLH